MHEVKRYCQQAKAIITKIPICGHEEMISKLSVYLINLSNEASGDA